jgi:Kef-type K+ transport system membrane component KefB
VLAVAVAGKLGGCALAARLAGAAPREALMIGTLMNTRGLMELVVMALFTTVMTTPLLLWLVRGTDLEPYVCKSEFCKRSRAGV